MNEESATNALAFREKRLAKMCKCGHPRRDHGRKCNHGVGGPNFCLCVGFVEIDRDD
jgi:hypothetical protein